MGQFTAGPVGENFPGPVLKRHSPKTSVMAHQISGAFALVRDFHALHGVTHGFQHTLRVFEGQARDAVAFVGDFLSDAAQRVSDAHRTAVFKILNDTVS